MNTYTEEELKKWFKEMKEEFKNSALVESLMIVELIMFNIDDEEPHCLEKKLKKVDILDNL